MSFVGRIIGIKCVCDRKQNEMISERRAKGKILLLHNYLIDVSFLTIHINPLEYMCQWKIL